MAEGVPGRETPSRQSSCVSGRFPGSGALLEHCHEVSGSGKTLRGLLVNEAFLDEEVEEDAWICPTHLTCAGTSVSATTSLRFPGKGLP